jgi:Yip1 domain
MAGEAADEAAGDVWVDSWFTIWYRPRATIRRIVDTDARKFVLGIAWMTGALAALNSQVMVATVDLPANVPHLPRLGPIGIAIVAFIFGVISVASLYGLAALYRWACHILGGTAQAVEVRAALAWSQVPGLYFAVVMIIAAVLGLYTPPAPPAVSPLSLVESIVGFWVFVVSLKCLGEVQRFSAWRALGAILLGTFAMFGVALGLVITIWLAVRFGRSLV